MSVLNISREETVYGVDRGVKVKVVRSEVPITYQVLVMTGESSHLPPPPHPSPPTQDKSGVTLERAKFQQGRGGTIPAIDGG